MSDDEEPPISPAPDPAEEEREREDMIREIMARLQQSSRYLSG